MNTYLEFLGFLFALAGLAALVVAASVLGWWAAVLVAGFEGLAVGGFLVTLANQRERTEPS